MFLLEFLWTRGGSGYEGVTRRGVATPWKPLYSSLQTKLQAAPLPPPFPTTLALIQAVFGLRVRNASYRASAEISNNLASRDLKALVDAGLLTPEGEKRGRDYLAAPRVQAIRDRLRAPRGRDDPFAEGAPPATPEEQPDLFG